MKDRELPIALPQFCCITLRPLQADEFHDNLDLENGSFGQCAIDLELISVDMHSFIEGHVSEKNT
jgi:hypothetical protein